MFPASTSVLCRFVRQLDASFEFAAIAVFQGLKAPLHKDSGNAGTARSLLAPISSFRGGGLGVSSDAGRIVCPDPQSDELGEVLEVAEGHVIFDSRRPRCTMDWKGENKDRVVLAAFTPLSLAKLSDADAAQLGKLGFKVPELAGDRPKVAELAATAGLASTGAVSSGLARR